MVEFNRPVKGPDSGAPSYVGASEGLRGSANVSGGMIIEGLGKALESAAAGADALVKENIDRESYRIADAADKEMGLDAAIQALNSQKQPPVPSGTNAGAAAGDDAGASPAVPAGATAIVANIDNLKAAKDAGNFAGATGEMHYHARLAQELKTLHQRYGVGYRSYVDAAVQRATGVDAPNALRQDLFEMQKADATAMAEATKNRREYEEQATTNGTLPGDFYDQSGNRNPKYDDFNVLKMEVANRTRTKSDLEAKQAELALQASQKNLDKSQAADAYRAESVNFVNTMLKDTASIAGQSYKQIQEQIAANQKLIASGGTADPQMLQQLSQGIAQLKTTVQMQLKNIADQSWDGEDPLKSYSATLESKDIDAANKYAMQGIELMELALTDPKLGIANAASANIEATTTAVISDAIKKNADIGSIIAFSKQAGSEIAGQFLNLIGGERRAAIDQALLNSTMSRSQLPPPAGKPAPSFAGDAAQLTTDGASPAVVDGITQAWPKMIESFSKGELTPDIIKKEIQYMFGSQNLSVLSGMDSESRKNYFNIVSSPAVTKQMLDLRAQGDEASYQTYRQWTMNAFQSLARSSLAELDQYNADSGQMQVAFDPQSKQFVFVPNPTFKGFPTTGDATGIGVGPTTFDFQQAAMLETELGQSKVALDTLNSLVAQAAPVIEGDQQNIVEVLPAMFSSILPAVKDDTGAPTLADNVINSLHSEANNADNGQMEGRVAGEPRAQPPDPMRYWKSVLPFQPRFEGAPEPGNTEGAKPAPLTRGISPQSDNGDAQAAQQLGMGIADETIQGGIRADVALADPKFLETLQQKPEGVGYAKADPVRAAMWDFSMEEMNSPDGMGSGNLLKAATTVDEAVDAGLKYLRPGVPHRGRRLKEANALLAGQGSEEGKKAFQYMQEQHGLTPEQAAGWVGNFIVESRNVKTGMELDPNVSGDAGAAFGMGQWQGNRQKSLEAFLTKRAQDLGAMPKTEIAALGTPAGSNAKIIAANQVDFSKATPDVIVQAQLGKIRGRPISGQLEKTLLAANHETQMSFVVDSGGQAELGKGPRERSDHTGSTRHDNGMSADGYIVRNGKPLNIDNPEDRPYYISYIKEAVKNGATGIGLAKDYMGSKIHIGYGRTEKPTKAGEVLTWGKGERSATALPWVKAAVAEAQAEMKGQTIKSAEGKNDIGGGSGADRLADTEQLSPEESRAAAVEQIKTEVTAEEPPPKIEVYRTGNTAYYLRSGDAKFLNLFLKSGGKINWDKIKTEGMKSLDASNIEDRRNEKYRMGDQLLQNLQDMPKNALNRLAEVFQGDAAHDVEMPASMKAEIDQQVQDANEIKNADPNLLGGGEGTDTLKGGAITDQFGDERTGRGDPASRRGAPRKTPEEIAMENGQPMDQQMPDLSDEDTQMMMQMVHEIMRKKNAKETDFAALEDRLTRAPNAPPVGKEDRLARAVPKDIEMSRMEEIQGNQIIADRDKALRTQQDLEEMSKIDDRQEAVWDKQLAQHYVQTRDAVQSIVKAADGEVASGMYDTRQESIQNKLNDMDAVEIDRLRMSLAKAQGQEDAAKIYYNSGKMVEKFIAANKPLSQYIEKRYGADFRKSPLYRFLLNGQAASAAESKQNVQYSRRTREELKRYTPEQIRKMSTEELARIISYETSQDIKNWNDPRYEATKGRGPPTPAF